MKKYDIEYKELKKKYDKVILDYKRGLLTKKECIEKTEDIENRLIEIECIEDMKKDTQKKENKKEDKKIYRIGDKIENIEKIEDIAQGIVKKALKVIEASGNMWATRIIEGKDIDTLEDLRQSVILKLIENNYVIDKDCYRIVNHILYNYKVNKIKNIEIVINEDTNTTMLDNRDYVEYIKKEKNVYSDIEIKKKIDIDTLGLTKRQLEILNIYSKLGSYQKVGDLLGVSRYTIHTIISRIKQKAKKVCNSIEF